jgi:hypothetical protein
MLDDKDLLVDLLSDNLKQFIIDCGYEDWTVEKYEYGRHHIKLEVRMEIDNELYT